MARTSCPSVVREAVWRKFCGDSMSGECQICARTISYTGFHVGHNNSAKNGGKYTVRNCKPLCPQCNTSMGGDITITAFKRQYFPDTKPWKIRKTRAKKPRKPRAKTAQKSRVKKTTRKSTSEWEWGSSVPSVKWSAMW